MPRYIRNNLISFDRFFNTLLGGDAELTFSGECWYRKRKFLIWLLDKVFGANHCLDSLIWDLTAGDLYKEK